MVNLYKCGAWISLLILAVGYLTYRLNIVNIAPIRRYEHIINTSSLHVTSNMKVDNFRKCPSVLDNMLQGSWKSTPMTTEQRLEMDNFLEEARSQHGIPKGLQRNDSLCGNKFTIRWFRSLCDPTGRTACCFNGQCVEKSIEECKCKDCYDMRQALHAEYSQWLPYDRRCDVKQYNYSEACDLIAGSTLVLSGDSLIRHIYTALLGFLKNNTYDGALMKGIRKEIHDQCTGMRMFTEKVCRLNLDLSDHVICAGRVKLMFRGVFSSDFSANLVKFIRYLGDNKTLVLFGMGVHDNYNVTKVNYNYIQPVLKLVNQRKETRLLWATPHSSGILKSSIYEEQAPPAMIKYISSINSILSSQNIPVFNTYNMTDGVMSFDGMHYGLAMNLWKVQMLLNYIQEIKDNGEW